MPKNMDEKTRFHLALSTAHSSDFDLNHEQPNPSPNLKPASVLVPLIWRKESWQIILTKRAQSLSYHAGQIAFAGGRVEAMEAADQAAMREAKEEIGLAREEVTMIGTLPHHQTVTNFLVTPHVAIIKSDFTATPNPAEVAEVFHLPLAQIFAPESFAIQSRLYEGQRRKYYTIPYGPYYIWGATAFILKNLAALLRSNS